MITQNMVASGKRKCAIAKATIKEGTGKITINHISYANLPNQFHKLMISEPVELTKNILGHFNFDIAVSLNGGGTEGRIEAARLAIAKAIIKSTQSPELKKAMMDYDRSMLVADVRRKEPYKPGDSKARSKRQKSYR